MKAIYEGEFSTTGFRCKGEVVVIHQGENEIPDGSEDIAETIKGLFFEPTKKQKRKPKKARKTKPARTASVAVSIDGES